MPEVHATQVFTGEGTCWKLWGLCCSRTTKGLEGNRDLKTGQDTGQ